MWVLHDYGAIDLRLVISAVCTDESGQVGILRESGKASDSALSQHIWRGDIYQPDMFQHVMAIHRMFIDVYSIPLVVKLFKDLPCFAHGTHMMVSDLSTGTECNLSQL